jgi:D-alanyl-D-alanine carboxypeptidase
MKTRLLVLLSLSPGCEAAEPEPVPLPADELQRIAESLVERSGAPGAVLGVMRGDQRWIGSAGSQDLAGTLPMPADATFRAGSITKVFTGALVLQAVEAGALELDDPLSRWEPAFPNASAITIEQLLSHTAGVTTEWFDRPQVQAIVTQDLTRVWTPAEVVAEMAALPPFGAPGASGMQYANTDFVLLGELLARAAGAPYTELLRERILEPLTLTRTGYGFDAPAGLVPGYFELGGAPIDVTQVPPQALISFAGAAGAIYTTADDLLTFLDAVMHGEQIVGEAARATMMTPAAPGSWYAHALMRFCPCADGPGGVAYTGWGHGGNLPGYWSVVVEYPGAGDEDDVIVAAMINRDSVDGVALGREVFDPTLAAVLDAVR